MIWLLRVLAGVKSQMEGAVAGADFPSKVVTFSNAEVAIWQNSWPEGGVSDQILPIDSVKGVYGQPLPC